MEIIRWTTPSITFTPSAVAAADIAEIVLVISQGSVVVIQKDINDALIDEGAFWWNLSQQETGSLNNRLQAMVKIDYVTNGGKRYTVRGILATVGDSAINEVIT